MNKFSKIVSGLKALLGQKAPSSAVTDSNSQLDWDNHQIPLEDGEWWMAEVAKSKPTPKEWVGKVVFVCNDDPFQTCEVCNNDKFVGQNKVVKPFVCGGCEEETRYHLGLMKAEKAADLQAEAMLLREVSLDRLSDAVDALCKGNRLSDQVDALCKGDETYPEPEWLENEECQCSDEGCYQCNPL